MGTIAARRTADHLDRIWELIGIASIACAQGLELVGDAEEFSDSSEALAEQVRAHSPKLEADRPLSGDIRELADRLRGGDSDLPLQRPTP